MIYVIGNPKSYEDSRLDIASFLSFHEWIKLQNRYQLDVETIMTPSVVGRKLRTIQFGQYAPSLQPEDKDQYVLIWEELTRDQKIAVLTVLNDPSQKMYIHNASFEYQVLLNYGVVMENVFDTMIAEKVCFTGYQTKASDEYGNDFFSLAGTLNRRYRFVMDKTYQTLFGFENELTEGHLIYSALDVQFLDILSEDQMKRIEKYKLQNILNLENEAVLAFADIEYNGMKMDTEAWLDNLNNVEPIIKQYEAELHNYLRTDVKLNAKAIELGIINTQEAVEVNWNSPNHKKELLTLAFPDLIGATKVILKKYMLHPDRLQYELEILYAIVNNNDYSLLFEHLLTYHRDYLVEKEYVIPAGTIRINWSSVAQVLPLFVSVSKYLTSLAEDALSGVSHPIVVSYQNYKSAMKLRGSYGEAFIEKNLCEDGKVRTRFNQVLETGRVSSSKPNMQQIPANDDVGNRYRNCFVPEQGFVFVDSDYASQELCVIATLSNDPVWMKALELGQDLHSICADLVYKDKWYKATEAGCTYATNKEKCSCKGHKKMRSAIKTVNFGLAYGMSQYKLAASEKISVKEAEALIAEYFRAFPGIGARLKALGRYGVENGHILTLAPFYRRRWFPTWTGITSQEIEAHLKEVSHNKALGSIERQSKNTPIQGCSADMMKLALVKTRRYINDNKLRKSIKLSMQVHDQLTTMCTEDKAEWWKDKLTYLMEDAAKVIIPSGLLKADTQISTKWTK